MLSDGHDGHAHDLAHTTPQVLVARGHDVAFVLSDALHDAVVGVGALVHAGQAFEARVFGDAQCDAVRLSELLELGHHAVGDVGHAFGVQTVHHRLHDVEFVFDREVDEVRVDDDVVGRTQLRVVVEEQSARCFWSFCFIQFQLDSSIEYIYGFLMNTRLK